MYSDSIKNLIRAFSKLQTVGERTAERFVFYLLKTGKKTTGEITLALKELMNKTKSCQTCWNFSDEDPCHFCANKNTKKEVICVVAEPQDVEVISKNTDFEGVFHVLRGLIQPGKENYMKYLKITELIDRVKKNNITEIILALNPNIEGESTAMYLEKQIKNIKPSIKITRLARGLPMGADLQYADEITLGSALKNRQ